MLHGHLGRRLRAVGLEGAIAGIAAPFPAGADSSGSYDLRSGGFTSYSDKQLARQLSGWVEQGIHSVKMKVGREAKRDIERVRVARDAIGREPKLFVDANGGYLTKVALAQRNFQRCR